MRRRSRFYKLSLVFQTRDGSVTSRRSELHVSVSVSEKMLPPPSPLCVCVTLFSLPTFLACSLSLFLSFCSIVPRVSWREHNDLIASGVVLERGKQAEAEQWPLSNSLRGQKPLVTSEASQREAVPPQRTSMKRCEFHP